MYIYMAKLKEGKEKPYKAWCLKNVGEYKKRVPQGWKLVDGYGAAMSLADFDVAWIWKFRRWSDWDAYYDLEDKVLEELMEEERKFFLPGTMRAVVLQEIETWSMPITKVKKK